MRQHALHCATLEQKKRQPILAVSLPRPQLDPKSVNQWWQEIFIYNSAAPIVAVSLNGKPLQLST